MDGTIPRTQPQPIIPPRPNRTIGAASPMQDDHIHPDDDSEDEYVHPGLPASENIWTDGIEEPQVEPETRVVPPRVQPSGGRSKVIRFRVVKLSKTGMYSEKVLALDTSHHVLLFQDPGHGYHSRQPSSVNGASPRGSLDSEKGFAMTDVRAIMPFDDAATMPSAPLPAGGAFHSRLLLLFQPELLHRSYELLFADPVQRNVFVAVVQELYGLTANSPNGSVEVIHVDEAPPGPTPLGNMHDGGHSGSKGPRWIPDGDVNQCMSCRATFTIMFRKHHCRSCGGIFCGPCSEHNASLPDLSYNKPVRVCNACFRLICDVRKQGLMLANNPLPSSSLGHGLAGPQDLAGKRSSFVAAVPQGQGLLSPSTMDSPRNSTAVAPSQGEFVRPVFTPPPALARSASTPLSPGIATAASPTSAPPGGPAQTLLGSQPPPTAAPTRDIYGFLLSSPTLALAAQFNPSREQTVMHVTTGESGDSTGQSTSSSSNSEGLESRSSSTKEDQGVSTLQSPQPNASTVQAAIQASIHQQQQSRLQAQHAEFEASRDRWNKYLVLHTHIDRNSTELKRLVRKGIPPELRGQVWQILSGSREKQMQVQQAHARRMQSQIALRATTIQGTSPPRDAHPSRDNILHANYYQHCLACSQVPMNLTVSVAEIDKDLHRTFPDNVLFSEPASTASATSPTNASAGAASTPKSTSAHGTPANNSAGLAMLRRVLLAYSFHNPAIGYCQSMNFLTAMLLLFMDESDAFFMLIIILEDLCCIEVSTHGTIGAAATENAPTVQDTLGQEKTQLYYHSPDLAGAHIDSKVFLDLIAEKLPKVFAQFEKLSFPLAPLTMSWLLCLFVNSLPLDTTLVLWDILFSEGVKILFRASLTLLKIHEKLILKCQDFEELLMVLKTCPAFHPSMGPGTGGMDGTPVLLPPAIDTQAFVKICFDPLWLGSFPLTRITALRNYHRLQVESDLAARKAKIKASKAQAGEREKLRLERLQKAMQSPSKSAASSPPDSSSSSVASSTSTALPPSTPLDPSVQFSLTSSPRMDLISGVTGLATQGVIEGFFASPSPLGDGDYVAILTPTQAGHSPRVGSIGGSDRLKHARTNQTTPLSHDSPSSSAISPSSKPVRPPKSEVKLALKRASLIAVQQQQQQSQASRQEEGISVGEADSSPTLPSPSSSTGPSSTSQQSHRTPPRQARSGPPPIPSSANSPSNTATSTSTGGANANTNPSPPKSPSMFSSVMAGVGRAISFLTEDERLISERARRERETAAAHHRARSASGGGQTQTGTPPQRSILGAKTPPSSGMRRKSSAGVTPPLGSSPSMQPVANKQLTQSSSASIANAMRRP